MGHAPTAHTKSASGPRASTIRRNGRFQRQWNDTIAAHYCRKRFREETGHMVEHWEDVYFDAPRSGKLPTHVSISGSS
jgi:hypothetical protein